MKYNLLLAVIGFMCLHAESINADTLTLQKTRRFPYYELRGESGTPTQDELNRALIEEIRKGHGGLRITALIEAGADMNAKDTTGKTALDYVKDVEGKAEYEWGRSITEKGKMIEPFVTTVSPQEIQHVIPGIIALQNDKNILGRDVASIVASQLIPEIVNAKLALAKKYSLVAPEATLRAKLTKSINRVITKSPEMQPNPQMKPKK